MKKFKLLVILSILTTGVSFGSIDLDTSKIQNTTIETGKKGNTIININTPNEKGISVNDFENFQTKDGVIFNNSGQKMNISQLEGIINGNPNITKDQAKLILNRVNGANRAEIESTLEAVGKDKVDMIFSSPNGVYLNGAKFIGFKDVTFTTAQVEVNENGGINDLVVLNGNIEIGRKGLDASKLEQISLLSKYLNVDGEVKGKNIESVTGSYVYDIDKKTINPIKENIEVEEIRVSSSEFGSIYGNQINMVVTKGNVALKGDIIANDGMTNIDIMNGTGFIENIESNNNIVIKHGNYFKIGNVETPYGLTLYGDYGTFTGYINVGGLFFGDDVYGEYANTGVMQIGQQNLNLSLYSNFTNHGVILTEGINFVNNNTGKNNVLLNFGSVVVLNDINDYDSYGVVSNHGEFTVYGNINNITNINNNGEFLSYGNINNANSLKNNKNMNVSGSILAKNFWSNENGKLIVDSSFKIIGQGLENKGILKVADKLDVVDVYYFRNYGIMEANNIFIQIPSILNKGFQNYGILNGKESINIEANRLLNAGEINTKKLTLSFKDYSSQGGKITADQITFDPYVD